MLGVGLLAGHSSCAIFCCTLPEGPADNSSGLAMTSSWRRTFGNVCSFVNNSMGGLRGGANLASWVVAGTLAYFLWVKPAQDLKREQEVVSSRLSCVSVLPFPFNRVSWGFCGVVTVGKGSSRSVRSLPLCREAQAYSGSTGNWPSRFHFLAFCSLFCEGDAIWLSFWVSCCRRLVWYMAISAGAAALINQRIRWEKYMHVSFIFRLILIGFTFGGKYQNSLDSHRIFAFLTWHSQLVRMRHAEAVICAKL